MVQKIALALGLAALGMSSQATMIDFERLQQGSNAGSVYSDLGVNFSRGNLTGNGFEVGDKVQWTATAHEIYGYDNWEPAWSGTRIGHAPGTEDLMITFDQAVRWMSLLSDRADPEVADVVRLIALGTPGGGDPWSTDESISSQEYQILGVVTGLDDGRSLLANTYSFTNIQSRRFVFQSTTEAEGIDDLRFETVPEPASMTALGLGVAALLRRRRSAR